jgi:hypothetical protein
MQDQEALVTMLLEEGRERSWENFEVAMNWGLVFREGD